MKRTELCKSDINSNGWPTFSVLSLQGMFRSSAFKSKHTVTDHSYNLKCSTYRYPVLVHKLIRLVFKINDQQSKYY